jgi:hypothetical protein
MSKEKSFAIRYAELKEQNRQAVKEAVGVKSRLNSKGKKHFIFPYLDDLGFDDWEKIYKECVLIAEKKSNQSREVRDLLVTIYHGVTKTS